MKKTLIIFGIFFAASQAFAGGASFQFGSFDVKESDNKVTPSVDNQWIVGSFNESGKSHREVASIQAEEYEHKTENEASFQFGSFDVE